MRNIKEHKIILLFMFSVVASGKMLIIFGYGGQTNDQIFRSVKTGETEKIHNYLEAGGDPNLCDKNGNTLLNLSIIHKKPKVTEELINEKNTNPDILNKKKFAATHLICYEAYLDICDFSDELIIKVLKKSKKINQKGKYESTPLIFASINRSANVLKQIIEFGGKVKEKNIDGNSALHVIIALYRQTSLLNFKILLKHGANLEEKNNEGKKPLEIIPFCFRNDYHGILYGIEKIKKNQPHNNALKKNLLNQKEKLLQQVNKALKKFATIAKDYR